MILHKIQTNNDPKSLIYITEDFRFYAKKNQSRGWRVFKVEPNGKYKFYKVLPTLEDVRKLI